MKILRWMSDITRKNRIRYEVVRGTVKFIKVNKEVQDAKLKWFGHVVRRKEGSCERQIMEIEGMVNTNFLFIYVLNLSGW